MYMYVYIYTYILIYTDAFIDYTSLHAYSIYVLQ